MRVQLIKDQDSERVHKTKQKEYTHAFLPKTDRLWDLLLLLGKYLLITGIHYTAFQFQVRTPCNALS